MHVVLLSTWRTLQLRTALRDARQLAHATFRSSSDRFALVNNNRNINNNYLSSPHMLFHLLSSSLWMEEEGVLCV